MAERDELLIEQETLADRLRRNGAAVKQQDRREQVLGLGLAALGSRALVFVTAASCLGTVWWTVVHPTTLTIVANGPGLLILALILWHDKWAGG